MIPDDELKQMREVCEKATPGPWFLMPEKSGVRTDGSVWYRDAHVCYGDPDNDNESFDLFDHYHIPDLEFIAMARNNFERVLDEVERILGIAARFNERYDASIERITTLTQERDALKAEVERLRGDNRFPNPPLLESYRKVLDERDAWKARAVAAEERVNEEAQLVVDWMELRDQEIRKSTRWKAKAEKLAELVKDFRSNYASVPWDIDMVRTDATLADYRAGLEGK
jgi:hypothetical protein